MALWFIALLALSPSVFPCEVFPLVPAPPAAVAATAACFPIRADASPAHWAAAAGPAVAAVVAAGLAASAIPAAAADRAAAASHSVSEYQGDAAGWGAGFCLPGF